jgi:hypothetical protein
MPQIIVIADTPAEDGAAQIVFRERVTERLFKSGHFSKQLVERIGWAVGDAHAADRRGERNGADPLAGTVPQHVSAETPQRPSERVVTTAS